MAKKSYQQWIVSVKREEGQEPTFEKLEKNFKWVEHGKEKKELEPVQLTEAEVKAENEKVFQNGLIYILEEA